MNGIVLLSALNNIDEDMISSADAPSAIKRNRKKRSIFVAAACIILLCALALIPILNRKNVSESHKAPVSSDVGISGIIESSDSDVSSVIDETREGDETLPQGTGIGGTGGCKVHGYGYHMYPALWTEYVGEEEFNKWYNEVEKDYVYTTTDCPCKSSNIYEFIKYFNIPKEKTIEFYNSTTRYYYHNTIDIDLLYDGTAEENDRYYRELFNDYAERYRKNNFSSMKVVLIQRNQEVLDSYLGTLAHCDNISIIEAILAAGISREQMEENIKEANSYMPDVDLKIAYDYDLDLVYEQREYCEKMIKEHSPFYMDLLFCSLEPRELPYE
ncbi:MAG: hypothetical protein KBT46_05175 [Ruminococcus sp.]|nr:hypothetical protein [Candidatus Copronaster equi]